MTLRNRWGFVGVGRMGGPMTERLLKAGYGVVVYDKSHRRDLGPGRPGRDASRTAPRRWPTRWRSCSPACRPRTSCKR